MAPTLYVTQLSPPVRAVLTCAKYINVELNLVEVNLLKKEHLKPEFLKLNPLHTVPTLDDNGFVVYDSHAIMIYLIDKYAKDKSLYPEDVEKRAVINQRLFFDSSVLFARHLRAALPVLFDVVKTIPEKLKDDIKEAYAFMDVFLQGKKYIAGNDLSIADISIFTSLTNANVIVPLDEEKYPHVASWRQHLRTLPFADIDKLGDEAFRSIIEPKLKH